MSFVHGVLSCWKPTQDDGYTVVVEGRGQQWYLGRMCCLNNAQKVYQEIIPHIITPLAAAWTFDTRHGGSTLSCCLNPVLTPECITKTRQHFPNLLLTNFFLHKFILSFLFRQEWNPVWSSAAVAHVLQGSTSRIFRDAFLPSGYLSYCCLRISLQQSAHSPLTTADRYFLIF